jgi:hypothetical protein
VFQTLAPHDGSSFVKCRSGLKRKLDGTDC